MEVSTGSSLKSQLHELPAGAACPVRPGADRPSLRTSQVASPPVGGRVLHTPRLWRHRLSPLHGHPSGPSAQLAAARHLLLLPWHLPQLTTRLPSPHVPPAASSPLGLHGMEEQGLAWIGLWLQGAVAVWPRPRARTRLLTSSRLSPPITRVGWSSARMSFQSLWAFQQAHCGAREASLSASLGVGQAAPSWSFLLLI